MKKSICFVSMVLMFGVGCAGTQKVETDNSALTKCETDLAQLQADYAELQARADKADALAAQREKNLAALRTSLKDLIDAGTLKVVVRNGLIVLQLPNQILFSSGKAAVKDDATATLNKVATALASISNRRFFVSGHTDNAPIDKANFKSNWDLSVRRGLNVHNVLLAGGVPANSLAVAGFGETDPVASNDSAEDMALNRRIEIILMPDLSTILPELAGL